MPHRDVALVYYAVMADQAVRLTVCQQLVNFIRLHNLAIFVKNVGDSKRRSTVLLINF